MTGSSLSGFSSTRQTPLPNTQILGCESGRATRMAPDAITEKIRDKHKSRFNSRQAVRSNPFMSKEVPGGGKSRQQNKIKSGKSILNRRKPKQKRRTGLSLAITTSVLPTFSPSLPAPLLLRVSSLCLCICICLLVRQQRFSRSVYLV